MLTRLKDFLTTPLVLTSLIEEETLLLYMATTPRTISATLVVDAKRKAMPSRFSG